MTPATYLPSQTVINIKKRDLPQEKKNFKHFFENFKNFGGKIFVFWSHVFLFLFLLGGCQELGAAKVATFWGTPSTRALNQVPTRKKGQDKM